MAALAAVCVAVGAGAAVLVLRDADSSIAIPVRSTAKPVQTDISAEILRATPARELVVMTADARVFAGARKNELLAQQSTLYYVSRARFTYSVDMRALAPGAFNYDPGSDVLKVKLPDVTIRADVYGPRERLASLAILASEGGSGNELERVASAALENDALREASRPELTTAAVSAAKYQVSKLYEDAFRAAGRTTRVVVFGAGETFT
jgi:hypothetical protein